MAATAFAYRTKCDSSSDSDSDASDSECKDWKRATRKTNEEDLEKIPIAPPPTIPEQEVNPNALKRKRNNIWCDVLQDQMISETLGHCGLKKKPKDYFSRGEESYDYTLSYENYQENEGSDETMSDEEKSETSKAPSGKSSGKSFKPRKFNPKFVKLDGANADAAKKIVRILAEPKKYLIWRVVKYVGIEKAMELLKKTEEIEENGGMMINNNQRRRSPGGIYLQLLKADKDIKKDVIDKVFEGELSSFDLKRLSEERKKNKREKKELAAAKKALLQSLETEMQSKQNPTEPVSEVSKPEDNLIEMEEGEKEETPVNQNVPENPAMQPSKDSDLEDGEIAE